MTYQFYGITHRKSLASDPFAPFFWKLEALNTISYDSLQWFDLWTLETTYHLAIHCNILLIR
jgi:hypothetical protein